MADANKDELSKDKQLNIRISAVQLRRLEQAAGVVSLERGEQLDLTAVARELLMQKVEEVRARGGCVDESNGQ